MKPLSNLNEDNQMQALLEEANQILKGNTDLNKEKEKLGSLFEEILDLLRKSTNDINDAILIKSMR